MNGDGKTTYHPNAHSTMQERLISWSIPKQGKISHRLAFLAICTLAAALFTKLLGSYTYGLTTVFCLFIFNQELFFTTKFRIEAKGASVSCGFKNMFISWDRIKRIKHYNNGMLLSPIKNPSPLDAFRGVTLIFLNNKPEIENLVKKYMGGNEPKEIKYDF